MKKLILFMVGVIGLLGLTACNFGDKSHHGDLKEGEKYSPVTVVLNYGKDKNTKQIKVDYIKGMTVLQALQSVAKVETYAKGKYVFVTSINEVKGKRGNMAWYYKINGKSPKELAFYRKIHPNDIIEWRFVKDVCSKTVDCEK